MVIEWGYTRDPKPRDLAARRPPERYNRFNRSDSKQGNLSPVVIVPFLHRFTYTANPLHVGSLGIS